MSVFHSAKLGLSLTSQDGDKIFVKNVTKFICSVSKIREVSHVLCCGVEGSQRRVTMQHKVQQRTVDLALLPCHLATSADACCNEDNQSIYH